MLDTNQIAQIGETAQAVKTQVTMNWPLISAAAVIVAREIGRFNTWAKQVLEWVMSHGGFGKLAWKLIWNSEVPK